MSNPNTTIQLLTVPWTSDYGNLRYFESANSQNTWFNAKPMKAYTGMQAVRVGFPYTVKGSYESLMGYNYLRFINNQDTNARWVYCFIDHIEYRSHDSTDIYFHLDYYQTYLDSITFAKCFIEREHTVNDSVPKTDEPIGGGDLAYMYSGSMWSGAPYYILATTTNTEGTTASVQNLSNNFGVGLYLYGFTTLEKLNAEIKNWVDTPEDIKGLYVIPSDAINPSVDGLINNYLISGSMSISKPTSFGGYTPKNNKCFYYPFCYAILTNNQGSDQIYRFENCQSDTIELTGTGLLGASPAFMAQSSNMNNNNDNYRPVYLNGSASVTFACDFFDGYMQRHQMDIGTQIAQSVATTASTAVQGGLIGGGAGAAVGAGVGAVTSLASTAMSIASGMNQAQMSPNPTTVTGTSLPLMFTRGKYTFSGYVVKSRTDYIKRVDDYFTRFGYNVQKIGVPNPNNRSSFYYCQTRGSIVRGNIPQEGRLLLESALNRGVTFWKIDEIGNYDAENN